MSPKLY